MVSQLRPRTPAHGPPAVPAQSFVKDDSAKSTVAFAIGGTTITAGGMLAWFAFGTALTALGTGALVGIGLLVMVGVVAAIIISAKGGI